MAIQAGMTMGASQSMPELAEKKMLLEIEDFNRYTSLD